MRSRRILHVVHALPSDTFGGSELYTRDVATELSDRGHEVAIAAPRGDGSEIPDGIEVHRLPATRPDPDDEPPSELAECAKRHALGRHLDEALAFGPAHGLVRPRVERGLADVLARVDPDVVHAQHLKGLSVRLPELCPPDARTLLTLHDFWTICEREQLVRPDGTRCEGPSSAAKCAACFAEAIDDGEGERFLDAARWRRRRLAEALASFDTLVAPSRFLQGRFERYAPAEADIVQRRNGIATDGLRDTGYDASSPLTVGYAGRITPAKGLHVLVDAVERVRSRGRAVELGVWGRFAPESEAYHARLADEAGEGVTFHGRYEQTAEPYAAMDVLVLPSVWPENSPLVVQEAFAANVPVVASDLGGMAELVTDGVDGATFPVGDAEALADVLDRFAASPERVHGLRAGVSAPKTLDEHVDELEALYAQAPVAHRPRSSPSR